jgi:hypothetical protein
MKKLIALFAGLFLMSIAVQNVNAQNPTQSATASASAYIIVPISIDKTTDMNFGNIVAPTANGTVILDYANNVTSGNVNFPSIVGTRSSARFDVEGEANMTFAIDYPASIVLNNGSNNMTLNIDSQAGIASTLDGSGIKEIVFGGELEVSAGQAQGLYTNTTGFTVTVSYN